MKSKWFLYKNIKHKDNFTIGDTNVLITPLKVTTPFFVDETYYGNLNNPHSDYQCLGIWKPINVEQLKELDKLSLKLRKKINLEFHDDYEFLHSLYKPITRINLRKG